MKRLSAASSRSMVRRNMSLDSGSTSSRSSSFVLLPRFWIGWDRSWTRPAAMRPNVGLAFLALHFLLQRDQAVGHAVEGLAQVAELVVAPNGHACVQLTGCDVVGAALQRQNRVDEAASEEITHRDHGEQRQRNRDEQQPLEDHGAGVGLARRLFHDHAPAKLWNAGADAEIAAAVLVHVLAGYSRVVGGRADGGHQRMAVHVTRLGDQRFLVGVAVRDQGPVRRDHHRVAVVADADVIDHAPHRLEAEFAGQPAGRFAEVGEADGEDGCRQQIFVNANRRHRHAVDHRRRTLRNRDSRLADSARGNHRALFVEQRQFPEFAKLQDVVLEDLILLRSG